MSIGKLFPAPVRRLYGRWINERNRRALMRSLRGDRVTCNVCGWVGAGFADNPWHRGVSCPRCESQIRHRLLCACIWSAGGESLVTGKRILHFAPESALSRRFRAEASVYRTADRDRIDVDLRLDMSAMPEIADGSYDVILACDVLEHIPDDRAALRELWRVCSHGGGVFVTVPQKDGAEKTYEDAAVTDPVVREREFGQSDHLRIYGTDFRERMSEAGFAVKVLDSSSFDSESVNRFVLSPPAPSSHPLATNFQRLYLGRKPAAG